MSVLVGVGGDELGVGMVNANKHGKYLFQLMII